MTQFNSLLYVETPLVMTHELNIQFRYFNIHSSMSLTSFLNTLVKSHHKHLNTQIALASNMLNIGQFIPIYISPELIICPLFPKRSTYQVYINMTEVIGLTSMKNRTRIHFKQNHQFIADVSITFCLKKWKECLLLRQLMLSQSV
ncbi:hypothetical protein GLV88_10380 [Staphylococcus hyicus]|uniref:hypothetical protein n=1 Tax=Staphylococcus hyicus TaxID=1284 RepID=UPI001430BD7E|nr:hypothetical protein [Staphylococcus hyicus]NJI00876.1 hypothetical protein [Staphylococcus hyicus]NJI31688.1 hypothetical protein [Staphylococcus hyicus]